MIEALPGCSCRSVRLSGSEVIGTNVNEECPHHGIGTDYYTERTVYWNERLRVLHELKKREQDGGVQGQEGQQP